MFLIPESRAARIALAAGLLGSGLALLGVGRPWLTAVLLGSAFSLWCLLIVRRHGLAQGRRHLFSPPVLMSAYMFLGIGVRGLTTLGGGPSKIQGAVDPTSPDFQWLYAEVFLFAFVGLIALLAGDALAARLLPAPAAPVRAPASTRPGRAVAVGVGLGLLAAAVLVVRLGAAIIRDPAFVATSGTFGLFWLFPLLSAPMYGLAFALGESYRRGEPTPRHLLAFILVAGLVVYVLTSSKAAVLNSAVLLLVVRHFLVRPVQLKTIAFAALLFIVGLPVFYLHRTIGLSLDLIRTVGADTLWRGFGILLNRSYLADSFAAVLHYTPQPYEYQLGRNWLEIFYFWIPRGIWPGKPVSYGLIFPQTYLSSLDESPGSFFSATLLGDGYLNFGPLGVPLLFLLLGLGLGLWYRYLTQRVVSTTRVMIYAASVYWIAISPEQSLEVALELALSYVGIAAVVATLGSSAFWRASPAPTPAVARAGGPPDG
ncbi:MAG TPA: oligosaccharide repeat unit polymerase [Gemmatimonadales bacterium]|nr:oligosaccharide repeat unit polymerase [Gemmatimonadales bacterium]